MSTGVSTWYFAYDADGMRTKRSNGTTTYTYVYNGSRLSQMTVGSTTYYFIYDASGRISMLQHGQDIYHYVTNIQGDVIAILDAYGNMVVEYQYDAWGNILSTSGSMASTLGLHNPLRYRGYVYDTETGLYYLQSRYYNPTWGRFINADSQLSGGELTGLNMFAYCGNNPVRFIDPSGKAFIEALVAAVGAEWACAIIAGGITLISGMIYSTLEAFVNWLSMQWYQPLARVHYTEEETLPQQGLVEGDPDAPPVDAGKQGKHVPGHKNYDPNKSSWPEGQNGVSQTQQAWGNGVQDPKKPNQNVRIGIADDGTIVRVHMDGNGAIHGYPLFWVVWP